MKITKTTNGNNLTVSLGGRLDTGTAPELEKELKNSLDGVEEQIGRASCRERVSLEV